MENKNLETLEMKQAFLSSAISDISSVIQLLDTKVSIIMGSLIALMGGMLACYDPIGQAFARVEPNSWRGVIIAIIGILFFVSLAIVFVFGILTVRGRVSQVAYKSKWFVLKPTKEYSLEQYQKDVRAMTNEDIIEDMAAELYKLNDINRRKMKTANMTIIWFAIALGLGSIIAVLLFF